MQDFIKRHHKTLTVREMADRLGINTERVRYICNKLNLGYKRGWSCNDPVKSKAIKFIEKYHQDYTAKELSLLTGMCVYWVRGHCQRNKLKTKKHPRKPFYYQKKKEVVKMEVEQITRYTNLPSPYGIWRA